MAGPVYPRLAAMVLAALLAGLLPVAAQLTPDFMPKGGKTLFLEVFGQAPEQGTLTEITGLERSEAEWSKLVEETDTGLDETQLQTLASYLAVNMPLKAEAVQAAAEKGDVAPALPADGRELAWFKCQSCHSLFAGYLTQDRDLEGWRNMFRSPFHRELTMTEQEREEFSHYSVINMPMKFEDIPEDLRF